MTFAADLATVLETSEKNAIVRASKLRILPACSRCLGSGRYSFNLTDGDRCFGCRGAGNRAPKTEAEEVDVITEALKCKEDGRFSTYVAFLEALAVTKGASKKLMDAWKATGISEAYDWRLAVQYSRTGAEDIKRHRDIADINKKMSDAYTSVADVHLDSRSEDYQAKTMALSEATARAIETIEAARVEFVAYIEANP